MTDDDLNEWADRPRGILTKKERRYLMGLLDESPEEDRDAQSQREYRIRQHLRHSLIDFQLLAGVLDRVLRPTFEELAESENIFTAEEDDLRRGIEMMWSLLYRALSTVSSEKGLTDLKFNTLLDKGVSDGVERMYARRGVSVSRPRITFHVGGTAPAVPLSKIKETYDAEEFLTPSEVKHLYWGGYVSYDQYQNHQSVGGTLTPEDVDRIEQRTEQRKQHADDEIPTSPKLSAALAQDINESIKDSGE
jgi:hypothetical protein